mmetsp:Transcript_104601/g.185275  ORF Transcript_104601/g.185275 Transcript_104601/m.185275 type:complete len:254 (-) Transcript_104601:1446-2207(-)
MYMVSTSALTDCLLSIVICFVAGPRSTQTSRLRPAPKVEEYSEGAGLALFEIDLLVPVKKDVVVWEPLAQLWTLYEAKALFIVPEADNAFESAVRQAWDCLHVWRSIFGMIGVCFVRPIRCDFFLFLLHASRTSCNYSHLFAVFFLALLLQLLAHLLRLRGVVREGSHAAHAIHAGHSRHVAHHAHVRHHGHIVGHHLHVAHATHAHHTTHAVHAAHATHAHATHATHAHTSHACHAAHVSHATHGAHHGVAI